VEVKLGSPGDMRGINPDIMGVAQRFDVDNLEDIADRPGQREIDRLPFDRCDPPTTWVDLIIPPVGLNSSRLSLSVAVPPTFRTGASPLK